MKRLDTIPAVRSLARRIVWFEPPGVSLRDVNRFLAYAMTYATSGEMARLRCYVSDRELDAALRRAPPGIMDKRSWAYWNALFGRAPPPPMPTRKLGAQTNPARR
jgi:hypothetical protein